LLEDAGIISGERKTEKEKTEGRKIDDNEVNVILSNINEALKNKSVTREQIRASLDAKKITTKDGKIYLLSDEQAETIRNGIRTFMEKLIPGGD